MQTLFLRPSKAITANKINAQSKDLIRTVPDDWFKPALRSMVKEYVSWASHIRRNKKKLFNNSINEGKAHLTSFMF